MPLLRCGMLPVEVAISVSGCGKASASYGDSVIITCHYGDIGAQVMLDTRIPKGDNFTDEAVEAASSKDKGSMLCTDVYCSIDLTNSRSVWNIRKST